MLQGNRFKNLFLLLIFLAALLSCAITAKFKIAPSGQKIRLMMIGNLLFSIGFYAVVGQTDNGLMLVLASAFAAFIGYSAIYVSNNLLIVARQYNAYENIFINVALIMLLANGVSYIVDVLLAFDLQKSALIFIVGSALSAIVLSSKMDFKFKKTLDQRLQLNKRDLYVLAAIILLLKVSEGVLYKIIEYGLAEQGNFFPCICVLPYLLALLAALYISYKIKRKLFAFLSACISLVGLGLLSLLISEDYIGLSNLFMHFGFGFLDIIIWGSIIYLTFVYRDENKTTATIMAFQILGIFIGGLIFEATMQQGKLGYAIAIISIFSAIVLVPKVNEITMHEIISDKEIVDAMRAKKERLKTRQKYQLLSTREREVVDLILLGKTNRQIAEALNIAETTVKTHCKNSYLKLGVKNKREIKAVFDERDGL